MPLVVKIESDLVKLELPDTTVVDYKFDYAQPSNNVAKGYAERIRLIVTIDVKEILGLEGSFENNLKLVQELRDWAEYDMHATGDSSGKYYRRVILKNYFGAEEIRSLELSHAFIDKSTESFEPLKGKHIITLGMSQKGDMHSYVIG